MFVAILAAFYAGGVCAVMRSGPGSVTYTDETGTRLAAWWEVLYYYALRWPFGPWQA